MAFIHTNFLTGNDTTGNGSTSTPYKTVFKGLSVAGSGDTIKVAGGQWSSALAGDFTFTQDSNVITTSVSQVGTVLVDDVLSFEDNQFGFDKFHIKVYAVTASTITTSLFWMGSTVTTNTVKRIDAYHYSQSGTSPAQYEAWNTTDVQPNGRTGITISGGWSSDFTAQNGWTVMRRTGQAITIANATNPIGFTFTASGGVGNWGTNLVWDRFMVHTINLWGNPGAGSSFAMNEIAMVKANLTNSSANYFGLWQANPAIPAKLYNSSPSNSNNMLGINSPDPSNVNRPPAFIVDVWATICWNVANTPIPSAVGGLPMASTARDGSLNQMNLYIRQNANTLYLSAYPGYTVTGLFAGSNGPVYLKKLIYYADKPQAIYLQVGSSLTLQLEDMEILGNSASESCFFISSGGQVIIDLSDELKTIDSFKPGIGWSGGNGTFQQSNFNGICQSNLSGIQVKDSEGLKTLDAGNNIYFKNEGVLKVSSGTSLSSNNSSYYLWKMIGVIEKPTTTFTVTFTLKVDAGAEANWDTLAVQYGPSTTQIITQALVPTSTYAAYTMTVNPANYSDWNKFKFPVYFGIRSKTANTFNLETMTYVYIQSVSIS